MRWTTTAGVAVLWLALSGCGASVTLSPTDSGTDVGDATDAPVLVDRPPPVDVPITPDGGPPPACVLPGGGLCPVGATCPAGDGCNICSCGPGGLLACTARFCPMDAGPAPCRSSADCPAGQLCDGPPGCATPWSCRPQTEPCTRDLATWCGCDGADFQASSTCPGRPYQRAGSCASASCVLPSGARCPVGRTCPAGDGCNDCTCEAVGMLRCTARPCAFDAGPGPSFDCDPLHVECGGIPDTCPPGQVHSVSDRCWGPCVDFAGCATLACDPAVSRLQCPPGALCSAATHTCQLATR